MNLPRFFSAAGLCLGLALPALIAGPIPHGKPSAYPDWWFERDVIPRSPTSATNPNPAWPDDYPAADDYAVVNLGQLKYIATKAAAEFALRLPGGEGEELHGLTQAWSQAPADGVVRDDYAALNQGQLKAVAKVYYDRLASFGYFAPPLLAGQVYPWTTATTDDEAYAVVNIGQLKRVFSFDIGLLDAQADSDGDGLTDLWEREFFGNLAHDGAGDFDTDGISDRQEFILGTRPDASAVFSTISIGLTIREN